jgi:tetratricopeptide (TPR) repeat protein
MFLKSITACVLLPQLLSVAGIAGADESHSKCIWIERLTVNAEILLAAESIKKSEREFVVSLTCTMLGLSTQAQAGIELAKRHIEPDRWPLAFQLIAGAQSESGDVDGAFRTADLIEHAIVKQRTLKLIVARQAQRGDSANALKLLDRIADATERDRALELIVMAHIDRGELDDAAALAERVTNPQGREILDRKLNEAREKPSPADPGFIERSIARTREKWAIFGITERDEELLRRIYRAEVAIHHRDADGFQDAMRSIQGWIRTAAGTERRNALIRAGALYQQFGDRQAAWRAYDEALELFGNSDQAIDFGRIDLRDFFDSMVQVTSVAELERQVGKLVDADEKTRHGTSDLIGGIVGATFARHGREAAERLYAECQTARQRFHAAVAVLDAWGKP